MSNIQIYSPVSVLSLIDIGKLADSYRRKSFAGTEKYQDKDNPNIYYSFKPAWQTWKKENSCFFVKITISIFVHKTFTETRFLWFHIYETPYGIKARCCENSKIRFGLASRRFMEAQYEEHSKTNVLLPIVPMTGSQLELAL